MAQFKRKAIAPENTKSRAIAGLADAAETIGVLEELLAELSLRCGILRGRTDDLPGHGKEVLSKWHGEKKTESACTSQDFTEGSGAFELEMEPTEKSILRNIIRKRRRGKASSG